MTSDEITAIARASGEAAAIKAVDELFKRLGVDVGDYRAVQEDFHFLRRFRQGVAAIVRHAFLSFTVIVVAGLAGGALLLIRSAS